MMTFTLLTCSVFTTELHIFSFSSGEYVGMLTSLLTEITFLTSELLTKPIVNIL